MTAHTPGQLATILGHQPAPLKWPFTLPGDPTPITLFGKDHWSTFGYVETRAVDHRGTLNHDQMRCDRDRHPTLHAAKPTRIFEHLPNGGPYPTRIKNRPDPNPDGTFGITNLVDHDDYDYLLDAVAAGLLTVTMPTADPVRGVFVDAYDRVIRADGAPVPADFVTGLTEKALAAYATWSLTDLGHTIAAQLRQHKANQGSWHTFTPTL